MTFICFHGNISIIAGSFIEIAKGGEGMTQDGGGFAEEAKNDTSFQLDEVITQAVYDGKITILPSHDGEKIIFQVFVILNKCTRDECDDIHILIFFDEKSALEQADLNDNMRKRLPKSKFPKNKGEWVLRAQKTQGINIR